MKGKQTKKLLGKDRLLDIMAARLCAFAFLKRAFLQAPTKAYLELLTQGDILEYFPQSGENELLSSGYESLSFYLRDPKLLTDEGVSALAKDYMDLFVGPGKLGAAPYESIYRSTKPLVFQEHTMEVRGEYAKYKLVPENFQQEPDDHIGLELDFLLKLTEEAMKELRAGKFAKAKKLVRAQESFLKDHLMQWVELFTKRLAKAAQTDFYRGVGKMLVGYLQVDEALVGGLLKEFDGRIRQEKEKRLVHAV